MEKLGLIAGNGKFPFLILDAARAHGRDVVVAAIKEETETEMDSRAAHDSGIKVYWMSLGELSRLVETFRREGVSQAIMAGQVKHKQIFSSIRPDWRLAKLLLNLRTRNTDALLGAVAKVLADEGITLLSSTAFLEPLLARPGVLSQRQPTEVELKNVAYGRTVARALAQHDIGQTLVVAEQACVAVEAMEGTDAVIRRAGEILRGLRQPEGETQPGESQPGLLTSALTVVKVAKPDQDMRFDVPVVGVPTIEVMAQAGATCLALDAGKCLLLDGDRIRQAADAASICIVCDPPA